MLSHSVVFDSMRPHGLQPARLLYPWGFPGKNTQVSGHALLQGIFPTPGSNPGLPHGRQILYHLSPPEKPSKFTNYLNYQLYVASSDRKLCPVRVERALGGTGAHFTGSETYVKCSKDPTLKSKISTIYANIEIAENTVN